MGLDFPILERELEAAHIRMDAAAFHGAVCGWLCAGKADAAGLGRGMLASEEELSRLPSGWIEQTVRLTAEALDDGGLRFSPLLPSDERPLRDRVRALATWCDAFLGAYGIAGGKPGEDEEAAAILTDLSAIARADDVGVDESEEESFVEILEYVRMAAVYLRMLALARERRQ